VFQVGDRVRNRLDGSPFEGTVVSLHGRWIHVKHDKGEKSGAVSKIAPRFDYEADELEHLNPLLKFVTEF
jgi:hypothetical protein